MRKKILGTTVLTAIVILLTSFFWFFSLINIFYEFELISLSFGYWFTVGLSLLTTVGLTTTYIIDVIREKYSKIFKWLTVNLSKLLLMYTFSLITFMSIKTEVNKTVEDLKEIVSIEWTILAISISVFLVWHIVIINYLNDIKPHHKKGKSIIDRWKYINAKSDFYIDANQRFNSVILLMVNLVVLVIVSYIVYFGTGNNMLLTQNLVTATFFISTNTLVGLFSDVLKPLYDRKKELMKDNTITIKDLDDYDDMSSKINEAWKALDVLDKLELDPEQKKALEMKVLDKLCLPKEPADKDCN